MKKLYVMVGVPAAGKSTWIANQNWKDDAVVVSTDEFVEDYAKECGQTYSEVFDEYMPRAVELMVEKVVRAREAGKDIIWDQTSTTVATRAKKLRMLPDYYAIAVVFRPDVDEVMRRIIGRIPSGKVIPNHVVHKMIAQWEDPTEDEGFKEIWYV